MTVIESMTVEFTAPMAEQIRKSVEAGEYASASEAVRDAMRLWSARRLLREQDLQELQRAWDEGKASSLFGPIDFDELRLEARKRLAEAT